MTFKDKRPLHNFRTFLKLKLQLYPHSIYIYIYIYELNYLICIEHYTNRETTTFVISNGLFCLLSTGV